MTRIFPLMQMVMALGTAVVYMIQGDFRKAAYWTAAFVITAVVTF